MKTTLRIKQSDLPFTLAAIAVIVILLSIYSVATGTLLGLIGVVLGGISLLYWDGSEIDFKNRKIREFSAIGPFIFGEWKALHPENETQIRSVGMAYTSTSRSMQTNTYINGEFKLMIKLQNGKFAMIKRSQKRTKLEALEVEILKNMQA
jgi:hypothetical protein